MIADIITVRPVGNYRLHLRFDDGTEGEVDISKLVTFDGVFEPLKDPVRFAEVQVNAELGTICWPNGADIDPLVLHAEISGRPR
jgi:hypothetical protein